MAGIIGKAKEDNYTWSFFNRIMSHSEESEESENCDGFSDSSE